MKSKKPIRPTARPRRRASAAVIDERSFTVVLEDLHAKFDAFGEALWSVRDELRAEMHGIRDELRAEMKMTRDELRTDIGFLRSAVLDLSKRVP